MAKEPRQTGLGQSGLSRSRENLAGQAAPAYDEALFGKQEDRRSLVPPTPWIQVPDSSRIQAYQYNPAMASLHVVFSNHGRPTGYVYNDVPTAVFQAFDAAPSKGRYVNSTLNFFPYHRAGAGEELGIFGGVYKESSDQE